MRCCGAWCEQLDVFAHRKFLDFFTFDAKSNVLREVNWRLKSVHLFIHIGLGSSYLIFAADSLRNLLNHSAIVVSEWRCNSKNASISTIFFLSLGSWITEYNSFYLDTTTPRLVSNVNRTSSKRKGYKSPIHMLSPKGS